MDRIPLVIGYRLDKAMQLLGENQNISVDSTITPYKDKTEERQGNTPIVVRQKVENDRIIITTCLFK